MNAYEGKKFINSITLPRYAKEGLKSYRRRLQRAVFFPFPKVIINKVIKFIEAKLHECELLNTGIEGLTSNINLQGKEIRQFGLDVLRQALITGKASVLVDSVHVEGELSLEAEKTLNVRPYAVLLKPDQIEDWAKDEFNNYIWVKVKSQYQDQTDPFDDRTPKTQYIIYFKDHYTIIKLDSKGKEVVNDYPYFSDGRTLSRVPVFDLCFEDSIIADIVELSKRYMQIDSLTDEEFNTDLFPLWVFPENSRTVQEAQNSARENDEIVLDLSEQSGMTYAEPDSIPKVIELKTEAVKSKMDYKLTIKKDISDLSGIDFINSESSWKVTSGESKKMDFIVTNANIAGYAESLSRVLTQVMLFMAEINGAMKPDVFIRYPKQYNVNSLIDQLNELLLIGQVNISDTYYREAKKNFVERNCESISDEKYKQIIEEIETMPAESANAFSDWANNIQEGIQ